MVLCFSAWVVVGLLLRSASCMSHRPHVVFILADDLGYNDIGYHARLHDSGMQTPFLDELAAKGVKLENYYVQPICTPSRSQLMSGRYQIHTGLQHAVLRADQRNGLPLNNKIIPEQLRSCGYDTHMIGKWHIGYYKNAYMPQSRGFNSYFGYLNGAEDYYTHYVCQAPASACGVDMHNTTGPTNSTWGRYSAFTFTDQAKNVIRTRDKSKPFFLYLAYQSVHFPMEVPQNYLRPFMYIKDETRRYYAGMLAALDEAVKNVSRHLNDAGMLNDTIFIFSTDNGGHTTYGGNNWPLRGRKRTLWEGGVKGVGFVSGKPLGVSNISSKNFMHISDWLPTLLTATNCPKIKGTPPLDGYDQWGAILQKTKSPRKELLHNIDPMHLSRSSSAIVEGFDTNIQAAIRSGAWKLITGDPGFSDWVRPPESHKSKDLECCDESKPKQLIQLFNIETDPYERHELSATYPHITKSLLSRLAAYNKTAVPVRFPPGDPKSDPKYHDGFWQPWADGELL